MQKVNAASVPRSERILGRANCLTSDDLGNCVRIRAPKTGHRFEVESADVTVSGSLPSVGIIVKKYSSTDCVVQFHGPMRSVYSGLAFNSAYVVGTDSKLSKPGDPNYPIIGSDFFQFMGVATSDDEFLIHPLKETFGALFVSARFYQQELVPTANPLVFTTPLKFSHGSVDTEVVSYNGQRLIEGAGNDYVASESGGVGTGYDTITLEFSPRAGSNWRIDYTPDV